MDDDTAFLRAFESCSLPAEGWTHRAHVRMAWLYLERLPFDTALERIRQGIQRYNASQGKSAGYHETVTCAFTLLVDHARALAPDATNWEAFAAASPRLFARDTSVLSRHYTGELITSDRARASFVAPDGAPLPLTGTVRDARPSDAAACAAIYAPYVQTTAITFETDPVSETEMARRIADHGRALPWLVFEAGGEVMGYSYASAFRSRAAYAWTVEVSAYVAVERIGFGVGARLYARLLSCLERLGYRRALAGIALPNDRSVALHERCGFVGVGVLPAVGYKRGAWHDVGFWQRELGEGASSAPHDTPPAVL